MSLRPVKKLSEVEADTRGRGSSFAPRLRFRKYFRF